MSACIVIDCDICGPERQYVSSARLVSLARREARALGWRHINGRDICPESDAPAGERDAAPAEREG